MEVFSETCSSYLQIMIAGERLLDVTESLRVFKLGPLVGYQKTHDLWIFFSFDNVRSENRIEYLLSADSS